MASINGHLTLSHAAVLLLLLLCATERASCVWTDFPANSLIVENLVALALVAHNLNHQWHNWEALIFRYVILAEYQPYHLSDCDQMWRVVFFADSHRHNANMETLIFEATIFSSRQLFRYVAAIIPIIVVPNDDPTN
ncbi:hypothetical protein AXF42_Ash012519 [Apostasia shenzhenica]|uniref:Uncharacterized protein n=1 Tax=Apostasia shenzhenica TaxID=1088818 RepID=A0A2I0AR10_9ASPA|nr:hypothetical protein AXF42_Ash012519 [Apostasia shenzhenica]